MSNNTDLGSIFFGTLDDLALFGISVDLGYILDLTEEPIGTEDDSDDGITPTDDSSDSGSDSSDSSSDDTPTVVDDDFTSVPGWTFGFTEDSLDAYGLNNNDLTSSYFSGIDLSGF